MHWPAHPVGWQPLPRDRPCTADWTHILANTEPFVQVELVAALGSLTAEQREQAGTLQALTEGEVDVGPHSPGHQHAGIVTKPPGAVPCNPGLCRTAVSAARQTCMAPSCPRTQLLAGMGSLAQGPAHPHRLFNVITFCIQQTMRQPAACQQRAPRKSDHPR